MSVEIELSAIDNMSKVFKSIERQMSVFEKTLEGLDKTLDDTSLSTKESTGQYLQNQAAGFMLNKAMGAATQGVQMLGQGLRDGFDSALNLEVAAVRMSHLIDDITFEELEEDIKSFARESWFSTAQVTKAWNELATVGNFTGDEIEDLMVSSNALASAIGIDLDSSARIVAKTLNAFNLEVSESGRVIDILTNAAAISDLTVSGLISAYGDVSGAAKLLNIDLDDITTALGMVADEAAVSGQEAGTFLNMFLTKIQNPTEQGKIAMEELGVSFFDAGGELRDLGVIFGELETSLARFDPEKQGQLLSEAFAVRGSKAVLAITQAIKDSETAWDDYNEAINETGTTMEIAGEISDTSAAKVRGLQSNIEEALIDIGALIADLTDPVFAALGIIEEGEKEGAPGFAAISSHTSGGERYTRPVTVTGRGGEQGYATASTYNITINVEGDMTEEQKDEVINAITDGIDPSIGM